MWGQGRARREECGAVGRQGQVEGGDAGRQRCVSHRAAPGRDPEDRARPVADVHGSVGPEHQPGRHAEVTRHDLLAAAAVEARHGAVETAGHVQPALRIEGERCRVGHAGREDLTHAARRDAIHRDRGLLPPAAAARRVDGAVGCHRRVVHAMETRGDGLGHLEKHGLARGAAQTYRDRTRLGSQGYGEPDLGRRRERHARLAVPDANAWPRSRDREGPALDDDLCPRHGVMRVNPGDPRRERVGGHRGWRRRWLEGDS